MDLYQELTGGSSQPKQNQNNMLSGLADFAKNFRGDPKAQVEQILKNNHISQEQYNNAVNQANMIYGILNKR